MTVVDQRPERLRFLEENLDIRTLEGNCGRADVLAEAGCATAGLVVMATDNDEVNLLAGTIAKKLGASRSSRASTTSAISSRRRSTTPRRSASTS